MQGQPDGRVLQVYVFGNPDNRRSIRVSQENFVVIFNKYGSFEEFKQEALERTVAFAREFSIQTRLLRNTIVRINGLELFAEGRALRWSLRRRVKCSRPERRKKKPERAAPATKTSPGENYSMNLRRTAPAKPRIPVPSNTKLPGSGTLEVEKVAMNPVSMLPQHCVTEVP